VGNEVAASRSEVQGEEPWGASAHACDFMKRLVIGRWGASAHACDLMKKLVIGISQACELENKKKGVLTNAPRVKVSLDV
jgi:hypothetical protein